MSNLEEYDVVVLGSGKASKYLAWTLASQGKRTAVIERKYLGGSCPNSSSPATHPNGTSGPDRSSKLQADAPTLLASGG
jgi:choline dehydrogenase-like flavoprotein